MEKKWPPLQLNWNFLESITPPKYAFSCKKKNPKTVNC